ncbi:MAG: ribosome maturation factor RimP [Eubacteriales bacterium]
MKQNIASTARSLVEGELNKAGFAIWDVRYEKDSGVWNLVFEVDLYPSDGRSMSMTDCERANAIINPIIDKADLIESSYTLEVSSAGLTRNLKSNFHFETACKEGWDVQIKLYTAVDGMKEFSGKISAFSGKEIEMGNIIINRKNIARATAVLG